LLAVWWRVYRQPAARHAETSREEAGASVRIPWLRLLGYRQTWAFAVGKFMADPIWWFYLTWLPDFFNSSESLDQPLDLRTVGLPFLVIYLVSDAGSVFFGWLSSWLLRRGWSLDKARKFTLLICALCVLPIGFAAVTHSIYVAVALIAEGKISVTVKNDNQEVKKNF
jgi:ACS family hexuronate transporter-like MFS transporter